MSRATIAAKSAGTPRSPLFGIAACQVGTEQIDFEIGWPEYERDVAWATSLLEASGVRAGDHAVVTMPNWEGIWASPVIAGLRKLGVVYMPAEPYNWDARRVVHLIQSMKPRIYLGICAETLDGLHGMGVDVAELLSGIELLWARHDAVSRLAEVGVYALPFVPAGPALVMGVPGLGGAVNSAEWSLSTDGDEILVSTQGDRLAAFTELRTGLTGRTGTKNQYGTTVTFTN